MSEVNAAMALKNAWNGAVITADRLRELAPAVQALPDGDDLMQTNLDEFHSAALAQSIAVMALRGLLEELRRKAGTAA